MVESKRKRYESLRGQLEAERQSFMPHWRDLADYVMPRRPRWQTTDANRGEKRSSKILDGTATQAARTLASGMMAGVTSPARPWFRLATPYPELNEYGPVKTWLHDVTRELGTIFLRSNLYNKLPVTYDALGTFATSALMVEEDFDSVVRFYDFPIGSYYIANSEKYKVEVFFREFRMTVRQIVSMFCKREGGGKPDLSNVSDTVREAWRDGRYETWIDVCHVIAPNDDYDEGREALSSKHKRFTSCYYEKGSSSQTSAEADRYLRESGYDYFPVMCPRWTVAGEDVYGTGCPGMDALPDIKQLQKGEAKSLKAIDKMIDPPMKAPVELKNQRVSLLPGDLTYVSSEAQGKSLEALHNVVFNVKDMEYKQEQVRQRINRAYYVDLFLMLATSDRRQITAREIEERHEEKLLALGPVLEQLNQDLLDPLIDITFAIANKQGILPPAPEELQGMPLKVEYISVMAQAQKLAGLAGIERFMTFTVNTAATLKDPTIMDKVDIDQSIDEVSEVLGVPPRMVRPDEQVAEIRAQRAKQQQAAQEAEAVAQGAKAAKDLSQTEMDKDSMMTRLLKAAEAGRIPA